MLTFREQHGVQPEAGPSLQARGQPGEMEAVKVENHLQGLPAAFDVVEDVGVCGRKEGWVTEEAGAGSAQLRQKLHKAGFLKGQRGTPEG